MEGKSKSKHCCVWISQSHIDHAAYSPTLGIPEVPSEPCLLLCPKTLFLALLLRKSAFLHLHIVSAEKLYALQVPPDAGSLSLCPGEPEALLFDISARTLNAWLKRLGELAGFDLPITSYWLRRGAGEALNSSCTYLPMVNCRAEALTYVRRNQRSATKPTSSTCIRVCLPRPVCS